MGMNLIWWNPSRFIKVSLVVEKVYFWNLYIVKYRFDYRKVKYIIITI